MRIRWGTAAAAAMARVRCWLPILGLLVAAPQTAGAEALQIAVAANFAKPLREIGMVYTRDTGHELRISSASTGTLYAQIMHGAPFDVFLAADMRRPQRLADDGMAEAGGVFTYARGVLALYSPGLPVADHPVAVLRATEFRYLAIANPRTAPYGAAAVQVLQRLGLHEALKSRLVRGESIGHALQFVATGNAELGFVALSQILDPDSPVHGRGTYWLPPQSLYSPLDQGGVVLARTDKAELAREFAAYLRSAPATAVLVRYGYIVPGGRLS